MKPITEIDMSPASWDIVTTFSGAIISAESGMETSYHGVSQSQVIEVINNMKSGDSIIVSCDD